MNERKPVDKHKPSKKYTKVNLFPTMGTHLRDTIDLATPECESCSTTGCNIISAKRSSHPELGDSQTEAIKTRSGNGCLRHYEKGIIFYSSDTNAHIIMRGPILDKYLRMGGPESFLGFPVKDQTSAYQSRYDSGFRRKLAGRRFYSGHNDSKYVRKGQYVNFESGSIYWQPDTKAHEVHGSIRKRWLETGGVFTAGFPKTDELNAREDGKYSEFQHGAILWSADTGSHPVSGLFLEKFARHGIDRGPMSFGYPKTDVHRTPKGRLMVFEKRTMFKLNDSDSVRSYRSYVQMIDGRILDNKGRTPSELKILIQNDPILANHRQRSAHVALDEIWAEEPSDPNTRWVGRCGKSAKDRYDASGEWCSEFVRWVYMTAGMRDIRYNTVRRVHRISTIKRWVKFFKSQDAFVSESSITPLSLEVGDYLTLTNSKGEEKAHSITVVGISLDHSKLWLMEGNNNDCVNFRSYDFFPKGTRNSDIDGIGKLRADFF